MRKGNVDVEMVEADVDDVELGLWRLVVVEGGAARGPRGSGTGGSMTFWARWVGGGLSLGGGGQGGVELTSGSVVVWSLSEHLVVRISSQARLQESAGWLGQATPGRVCQKDGSRITELPRL